MFSKINTSLVVCLAVVAFAFAGLAGPAAAQGPLGVLWVVDEWDGEVMPVHSGDTADLAGDYEVDEWDGEVMPARSTVAPVPYLLLVVEAPSPGLQAAVRAGAAPATAGVVDGKTTGVVGSCQVMVAGEPLSYRVVKTYALHSPEVLPQPQQPQP
jgi:hypothetical protein